MTDEGILSGLAVKNGDTTINTEGETGKKDTIGKRSAWMDYNGK